MVLLTNAINLPIKPAKTNQRDLQVKRPLPRNQKIAVFPAETNPPPGSRKAEPIDRVAAQSRSGEDPE